MILKHEHYYIGLFLVCLKFKVILKFIIYILLLARDEITNAIKDVIRNVRNGDITIDDIDENLISKCLYTHNSEDPDLLIRTSGEVRFSDFLMWQVSMNLF
jgi:undecaprenyl diphosphate synthase